ncbi:hypothetical protein RHMOL_Rhmol04G0004800 [Rhododendron molle]|uniref:Uncharacterized protein n=1 Tax=Rhododendron molle TaxID=49168 RepID=A0ACC0NWT5_RHOML|nr:hypothetical protein RHMOL_Rhmol04G0004800 [Rhododendron molle]
MEVEKMISSMGSATNYKNDDDDVDFPLPGFRFHPTDEELVGFYLRRMIEKKPLRIQLINQVDIYKYDPWDLPMHMPSEGGKAGDKECYFFCKRGKKYKNSVRPNRVTGSGFWKATGIDRPIYSTDVHEGEGRECIGLKKSLVYYRGKAGKGTKTDWMMHEYRLPDDHDHDHHKIINKSIHVKNIVDQEAEVWTLCRILERNASCKKYNNIPDWREEVSSKTNPVVDDESCKTCGSVEMNGSHENYVMSSEAPTNQQNEKKQFVGETNQLLNTVGQLSSTMVSQTPSSSSSPLGPRVKEFTAYGDWDELTPVVEFAFNPSLQGKYM